MFEAFKSGLVTLRNEDDPTRWTEGYDFPALRDGRVVKEELPVETPAGMSALVFNTRRPIFADPRVREALIKLFDFEWVNRTLYHGQFARSESYFARSGLSSHGRPADARERNLLAPYADEVKPEIMNGSFAFPVSDGTGENREGRREALALLEAAGYQLKDGKLVKVATGEPFEFEILAATRAQERLLLTYAAALKQVGIEARIRQVDSAQYQRRKQTYDFDMIQYFWPVSLSPGNEQSFRWGSEVAVTDGSFNYPGVKSQGIDAMIEAVLKADDDDNFVSAVRALDRVLLSGDYVIPLFHLPRQWVAHWADLKRPSTTPLYGYQIDTWWLDPSAAQPAGAGTGKP
jgi:peptide/nickel transport system substrate-binding protein